jgi:hypothetical protein
VFTEVLNTDIDLHNLVPLDLFPLMFFHGGTPAYKNGNKERRQFVTH